MAEDAPVESAAPTASATTAESLVPVLDALRRWAREGPPSNPRAAAGELAATLQELHAKCLAMDDLIEQREASAREEGAKQQGELAAERAREVDRLRELLGGAEALAAERDAMRRADCEAAMARAAERALAVGQDEVRQLRQRVATLSTHLSTALPPVSAACRVRPLESYSAESSKAPRKTAITIEGGDVIVEQAAGRSRRFRVDRVLDGQATQEDLFNAAAPWVENVSRGGSSCVFAHGATGSGKTHSMLGRGGSTNGAPGLAHNALRRLVEGPSGSNSSEDRRGVRLSMLEVYCEHIRDLLAPPTEGGGPPTLQCSRRDGRGRMQLDAAEVIASGMAEVDEVLRKGFRNRKTEGTLCNEQSSRSHVVLTVTIDGGSSSAGGRLVLVDLAGSENVQRSGADEGGQLLAEARAINRSLSALGDVIEATAKQQAFVPYRNSRLTMLLEEPLAVSKVLLLAHVSPMARDATDTAHSLQFAGHVRGLDFGAQRMRLEQEEQQRAAHRSQQEARHSQQEAQRYQLEARQLQGQLEQSRKEQSEAQKLQQELRQQVTSLTDQLRDSRRELGKEQALRMRAESSTPRGPQYQRHGSTGSIHAPASQSLSSSPAPPSRLMVPQRRAGTPVANTREPWRTWTDAPDGEGPTALAPARRARPERSPLGDRTNQEASRASLGTEPSGAKLVPEILGLPKDLVGLKLGKDEEDEIVTPRANPDALTPARSPECSPLRHGGAPVASPQRSPVPSPPYQERTVIGLVERGPDASPRSSRSPTGSDAALSSARRRLSVLEPGEAERCSVRFNLYDGVQVRSVLRQFPTDFKAKLLNRQALGLSATRRECRRVAFSEQQPEPRSPPKWYLEAIDYKLLDDPQPVASTAATGSSPRSLTPPIRRSPRDSASMRNSSDLPARWR